MSKARKARALLFVAIWCAAATGAQEKKIHPVHEQTIFSEQEPLQHPVHLTPAVLKALLVTEAGRQGLESANESQRSNPEELFRAAEVHLNGPGGIGLLVIGIYPMSGADNDWFWVIRSVHTQPQVVLFTGANSLELMSTRTNGYRNIRTGWSSASETVEVVYHFDGKKYKPWKKKATSNK